MATALEWPDGILPSTFDWSLSSNGTSFTSPWNGQTQAARFPGSAWNAAMTLNNLDDLESRYLEVMIVELDGLAGGTRRTHADGFRRATRLAPAWMLSTSP